MVVNYVQHSNLHTVSLIFLRSFPFLCDSLLTSVFAGAGETETKRSLGARQDHLFCISVNRIAFSGITTNNYKQLLILNIRDQYRMYITASL